MKLIIHLLKTVIDSWTHIKLLEHLVTLIIIKESGLEGIEEIKWWKRLGNSIIEGGH
jgi:hypothetical protein